MRVSLLSVYCILTNGFNMFESSFNYLLDSHNSHNINNNNINNNNINNNNKIQRELYTDSTRSFNYSRISRRYDPTGLRLDYFGNSVAIQPGVALVGVPDDDDNEIAQEAGSVFIYIEDSSSGDWRLIRKIEDGEPGDQFGWAVALNTDLTAVVGAWRGNVYGTMSGAAYYFDVQANPNEQQMEPERFLPSERHGSAYFGYSVAIATINGRVIAAIGAYNNRMKGAVFIFSRRSDGTFQEDQIVVGAEVVTDDNFGFSVSLYNDILAAGSPMDNKQGSAYVFQYANGQYTQIDKLSQSFVEDDANNPLYGDAFGFSVAVGHGYVAVSSPHNDVRATDAGAVYVYTRVDRRLEEVEEIEHNKHDKSIQSLSSHRQLTTYSFSETLFARKPKAYTRFGYALAADPVNDRLVVGTDVKNNNGQGSVYIYSMTPATYFNFENQVYPANNENDDTYESDTSDFGAAVSIYGDYLLVGAPLGQGDGYQTGDVYFYRAQTKKEYNNMVKGVSSDSESTSETEITPFEYIGFFLLVAAPLFFCLSCIFFWRRYKAEGDQSEGFATFVTEEIGEMLSSVSSKPSPMGGISTTHFGDEESDESQHSSSHPMVSGMTSGTRTAGGAGKTKLSSIKASSASSKRSSGAKRGSGYSSTNIDDSQDGL